jgi:hypothetical protein
MIRRDFQLILKPPRLPAHPENGVQQWPPDLVGEAMSSLVVLRCRRVTYCSSLSLVRRDQ